MKDNLRKEEEGFHVICGTGPKNGITGTIPETGSITGDIIKSGGVLDLSGLGSLLIADLNFFVGHHEKILELVKEQIEERDYFKEHPEELEEARKNERKLE